MLNESSHTPASPSRLLLSTSLLIPCVALQFPSHYFLIVTRTKTSEQIKTMCKKLTKGHLYVISFHQSKFQLTPINPHQESIYTYI